MKNSRKTLLTALVSLPLVSAGLPTALWAQDEDPVSDASPAPMDEQSPADGELPPTPPTDGSSPEVSSPAPTEEAPIDSTPLPGEDAGDSHEAIPEDIQSEVDENGPAVDERYNSLNGSGSSILSDIYVGPTVQVGFPQILSYGIETLFARTVSVGVSTGKYTVDQIDKAEVEIKGWDVHARWHPWMGSFFVGASYGRMEVDGDFEDKFKARISGFEREVQAKLNATIKTNYFTPRLGWFAVWESGLTFGFDIGAQIPLGPDTKLTASFPGASPIEEAQIKTTEDYKDLEDQADQTLKVLGKRTIPVVTLLQVGWLF